MSFEITAALASVSPKDDGKSQDRCGVAREGSGSGATGVIVCDGVGAYKGSGEVADRVVKFAAHHLAEHGMREGLWNLATAASESIADDGLGATTLLAIGAEEAGYVGHCLVGNGMLLEAVPVAIDGGRARLRWVERALPHIRYDGGRPTLASFLPWTGPGPLEAGVGAQQISGRRAHLFLACSDGIGSDEERLVGAAPDGSVWTEVPAPLARMLDRLADAWPELSEAAAVEEELTSVLDDALAGLVDGGALDDDATVGALLLRPNGATPGEAQA